MPALFLTVMCLSSSEVNPPVMLTSAVLTPRAYQEVGGWMGGMCVGGRGRGRGGEGHGTRIRSGRSLQFLSPTLHAALLLFPTLYDDNAWYLSQHPADLVVRLAVPGRPSDFGVNAVWLLPRRGLVDHVPARPACVDARAQKQNRRRKRAWVSPAGRSPAPVGMMTASIPPGRPPQSTHGEGCRATQPGGAGRHALGVRAATTS